MFRKLKADEIECRVAQISKESGSLSLLLYKDARCDMNILDETVGAMYWMREHSRDNANCKVSIYNEDLNMWVSKEDTGTDSNTEAEKGRASDSFKRACVNWGIGRELYTAPPIWISKSDYTSNSKGSTYDRFKVTGIDYDKNGNISYLAIENTKLNRQVFVWGSETKGASKARKAGYPTRDEMLDVVKAHYPDEATLKALLDSFGIDSIDDATDAQLMAVYNKYGR